MDDKIAESLGIEPIPTKFPEKINRPKEVRIIPPSTEVKEDEDLTEKDFEFARGNLINVAVTGNEALEDMLNIARSSEHPRAYEVIATLMKTLVETSKDLVELGNKHKETKNKKDNTLESEGKNVTNNNLFVGSTEELLKRIQEAKNEAETNNT